MAASAPSSASATALATSASQGSPAVALSERSDIHKSCKALESIINVFNDYCQAADALVTLQKKLAKALKEAAVLKGTSELASEYTDALPRVPTCTMTDMTTIISD